MMKSLMKELTKQLKKKLTQEKIKKYKVGLMKKVAT